MTVKWLHPLLLIILKFKKGIRVRLYKDHLGKKVYQTWLAMDFSFTKNNGLMFN